MTKSITNQFLLVFLMGIIILAFQGCGSGSEFLANTAGASPPHSVERSSLTGSPFGAHGSGLNFSLYSEVGIGWKRMTALDGLIWEIIDPENDGTFDWTDLDQKIAAAIENNINVFITVQSFSEIDAAICRDPNPEPGKFGKFYYRELPCDLDKYKAFVRAAVIRYGDTLVYQLENEIADDIFWKDSAENYALLLKETYITIKENCPTCIVSMGGATKPNFLSSERAHGTENYFEDIFITLKTYPECAHNGCHDIFDLHDLAYDPDLIKIGHDIRKEAYENLQLLQQVYSFEKPIWSTEVGVLFKDLDWNKKILIQTYVTGLHMGIEKLFWRITEDCCAITHFEEKTVAYDVYKTLIAQINNFSSIEELEINQYKFNFEEEPPVYVLWCENASCNLPTEITGLVEVTDDLGNTDVRNADDISLTSDPIFVKLM